MNFEIKHKSTGAVLFTMKTESMKLCLEATIASGANMRDAYLRDAYLRDANLSYADLSGADLSEANLHGANLSYADLRDANLSGADLSQANLHGANLSGADLYKANLSRVEAVSPLGCPDGWPAFVWHHGDVVMVQAGCKSYTLQQGREYWAGKANRREVLAALDYAEAIAKIRGWE